MKTNKAPINEYFSKSDKDQRDITLVIEQMYDEYAEPTDFDCYSTDPKSECYHPDNQAIIDAWKNDQWHYCGVRVKVKIHNWKTGNVVEYTSPGLWGIEDQGFPYREDYDPEAHLREAAAEQLAELQAEYPALAGLKIDEKTPIRSDY